MGRSWGEEGWGAVQAVAAESIRPSSLLDISCSMFTTKAIALGGDTMGAMTLCRWTTPFTKAGKLAMRVGVTHCKFGDL